MPNKNEYIQVENATHNGEQIYKRVTSGRGRPALFLKINGRYKALKEIKAAELAAEKAARGPVKRGRKPSKTTAPDATPEADAVQETVDA